MPLEQSLSTGHEMNPPPSPSNFGWRGVLVIVAIIFAFFLGGWFTRSSVPTSKNQSLITPIESFEQPVTIQVSGQVRHPGIYTLSFNARIYQAIEKAGGALPNADLDSINLADWVKDGSQISVLAKNDVPTTPEEPTNLDPVVDTFPLGLDSTTPGTSSPKSTFTTDRPLSSNKSTRSSHPKGALKELPKAPVDLNRATSEQLQQLPGIGSAMADRILTYRKENRGFTSVDDLDNVRGIGTKKLEKIRPFVLVKPLPSQKVTH
ncbi:MAG: helix-hairpin-helix domain-containing protein [Abditibacteriaceae bacterium]